MSGPMVKEMIEYRRLARHARCEIKAWRVTELEAWKLADEMRWIGSQFDTPLGISAIVDSMKRGEVRMMGALVVVK